MDKLGNLVSLDPKTLSKNSERLEKVRQQMAIFASRLFNFYHGQELAANPEIFLAGVVQLFTHYPAEIVERAVSPVFGLPSKHKFPPRISEIKEFLDGLMPKEIERAYPVFPPISSPDRSRRPTYGELQARCAKDGLIIGKPKRADNPLKAADEFKTKFGVSQEVWNSIPDRKYLPE